MEYQTSRELTDCELDRIPGGDRRIVDGVIKGIINGACGPGGTVYGCITAVAAVGPRHAVQ